MPQPFELAVTFSKIQNKKILIIDDVYTTGQTLFPRSRLFAGRTAENHPNYFFGEMN